MRSDTQELSRWEEITLIWKQYKTLYGIAGFIVGLIFFPALNLLFHNLNDLLTGLVPEFVGIAFTVFLIDALYRIRDEQRQIRELKERLISDISLNTNVFAKRAASILWRKGWLQDGSLIDANLEAANLEGAYLVDANLANADLHYANLVMANLRRSKLLNVDLRSTDLRGANLQGADISGAKVYNNTLFDQSTILPNGIAWTTNSDLGEFNVHFVKG